MRDCTYHHILTSYFNNITVFASLYLSAIYIAVLATLFKIVKCLYSPVLYLPIYLFPAHLTHT